jgi:C-terminal processing protease CtpA/Prc
MRELSVAIRKLSQSTQLGLVLGSDDDLWEPMTISEINPEGLAHRSALRTGDRVVAINGKPVHNRESATQLLQESLGCVELLVRRDHASQESDVASGWWDAEESAAKASARLSPPEPLSGLHPLALQHP